MGVAVEIGVGVHVRVGVWLGVKVGVGVRVGLASKRTTSVYGCRSSAMPSVISKTTYVPASGI